jgi:surfactin synthase thioesterase subunit
MISRSVFSKDVITEEEFLFLVKRYHGMAPELLEIPEYYDYFAPILKRDFITIGKYKPLSITKLPLPIHVFWADKDPDMVSANIGGWREYSDNVRYIKMSGGHFYIKEKAEKVCSYIKAAIDVSRR